MFLFWIQGPISAVVVCLLSLRDRFNSHLGEDRGTNLPAKWVIEAKKKLEAMDVLRGGNTQTGQQSPVLGEERRPSQTEAKLLHVLRSPVMSGTIISFGALEQLQPKVVDTFSIKITQHEAACGFFPLNACYYVR